MLEFPIYVLCIAKCAYKFVHKGCKSFSQSLSVCACLFGLFFNFNFYHFISFSSRYGHCKKLASLVINLSKVKFIL